MFHLLNGIKVGVDDYFARQHDSYDDGAYPRANTSSKNPDGRMKNGEIEPGKPEAAYAPYNNGDNQTHEGSFRFFVCLSHPLGVGVIAAVQNKPFSLCKIFQPSAVSV